MYFELQIVLNTGLLLQIGIAVARICKAVDGLELGPPDLDGTLRVYKKVAETVETGKQTKQTKQGTKGGSGRASQNQASQNPKEKKRKLEKAAEAGAGKASKRMGQANKQQAVEKVKEPEVLIFDELEENALKPQKPKPKENKKKKAQQKGPKSESLSRG